VPKRRVNLAEHGYYAADVDAGFGGDTALIPPTSACRGARPVRAHRRMEGRACRDHHRPAA